MSERSVCIVPGCRNSSARFAGFEYICGPHWRMIPNRIKRRDRRVLRALRRRGEIAGEGPERVVTKRARRFSRWSWELLKRSAIEAGAGL